MFMYGHVPKYMLVISLYNCFGNRYIPLQQGFATYDWMEPPSLKIVDSYSKCSTKKTLHIFSFYCQHVLVVSASTCRQLTQLSSLILTGTHIRLVLQLTDFCTFIKNFTLFIIWKELIKFIHTNHQKRFLAI